MDEQVIDGVLAALADPNRRRIVSMLAAGPMPAGAIGEAFTISAPALSKHLRVLRQRGVVTVSIDPKDNRVRLYELQPSQLQDLQHWLTSLEAHWQAQLAAL